MPKAKSSTSSQPVQKVRPALTPEARENQLIAEAIDLVEQRLLNGTASSQETTHFLKLGSMKNRLEMAKLEEENKLLRAKTEALQAQKNNEELYAQVLSVLKDYAGYGGSEDVDEPDEY